MQKYAFGHQEAHLSNYLIYSRNTPISMVYLYVTFVSIMSMNKSITEHNIGAW